MTHTSVCVCVCVCVCVHRSVICGAMIHPGIILMKYFLKCLALCKQNIQFLPKWLNFTLSLLELTNINLLSARVDQSAAPTTSHAPSPHTRTVQRHTHGIDSVVRHKQLSAAGYPLPINQSRRGGLRSFNDHGEVGGHGGRRRSVGGPRGTEHGELCTHQSTLVETKLLFRG